MPKIMIIKYQQFAKTNTFSLSFHILFSPFWHIFPHFSSRHIEIRIWGWAEMGLNPPPPYTIHYTVCILGTMSAVINVSPFQLPKDARRVFVPLHRVPVARFSTDNASGCQLNGKMVHLFNYLPRINCE